MAIIEKSYCFQTHAVLKGIYRYIFKDPEFVYDSVWTNQFLEGFTHSRDGFRW